MTNNVRIPGDLVATHTKFGWFSYGTDIAVVQSVTHLILCALNVGMLPEDISNTIVNTISLSVPKEVSGTEEVMISEAEGPITEPIMAS